MANIRYIVTAYYDVFWPTAITLLDTKKANNFYISSVNLHMEVNTAGTLEMQVLAGHPDIEQMQKFKMFVSVYRVNEFCPDDEKDNGYLFLGRLISESVDIYGNKSLSFEGGLSFINDRMRFVGPGGWSLPNSTDGIGFIKRVIEIYNPGTSYSPAYYNSNNVHNLLFKAYGYDPDGFSLIRNPSDEYETGSTTRLGDLIKSMCVNDLGVFLKVVPTFPYNDDAGVHSRDMFNTDFVVSAVSSELENPILYSWEQPDESSFDPEEITIDDPRYPQFIFGKNILDISWEYALDVVYTTVIGTGQDKNGNVLTVELADEDGFSEYGDHGEEIQTEAKKQGELSLITQKWLEMHKPEAINKYYNGRKYTITAPEPCSIGFGQSFVDIMYRAAITLPDAFLTSEEIEAGTNKFLMQCLSMDIDILNGLNNKYVFGPYISDAFTDTNVANKDWY
jgi:hypothetical protein